MLGVTDGQWKFPILGYRDFLECGSPRISASTKQNINCLAAPNKEKNTGLTAPNQNINLVTPRKKLLFFNSTKQKNSFNSTKKT
jgi:hypothetical protein